MMLNILESSDFAGQNNNLIVKNRISAGDNKQMFAKIFDNEGKNLSFNNRNTTENITYSKQDRIRNPAGHAKGLDNLNKSYNKFKSYATGNKTPTSKMKQLKEYKDINIDETVEDIEEELTGAEVAVSLQSILLTMPENLLSLEDIDSEHIEINTDQLQNLDSLKEQLLSLLESTDTLIDDSFRQDIEGALKLINKMGEEHLLDMDEGQLLNNKIQPITYESDKLTDNLNGLKNSIQSILNRLDIGESADSQKPYTENNLSNLEEQTAEDEGTLNPGDIKGIKDNIRVVDRSILDDDEQLFRQSKDDGEILFGERITVSRQNTIDQSISLKAAKDQIIEPRQFISEIAQKAGTFILKGKNEMNIRLIPENLGKLSIEIGLNEGTLTGKIYTENYSVKETIEANLNQLRDSLEEQGLNIANLEVYINDNSQNFERGLYQSKFANRRKPRTGSIETGSNFITSDEDTGRTNPYLITSRFEGSV